MFLKFHFHILNFFKAYIYIKYICDLHLIHFLNVLFGPLGKKVEPPRVCTREPLSPALV